jgi:hypothetical protein
MPDFIANHKELWAYLGLLSVITFIGSLLLIPLLVIRMNDDYFMPERNESRTLAHRHPVLRFLGLVLKNGVGLLLLLSGLSMLVLPGQGLLTIVMGLMLLNFPGKRALELRLIRLPALLRTLNALRAKANRPPLRVPPRTV